MCVFHAITTVSGVVHGVGGRVVDGHVYAGSGGIAAVVLALRIVLDRVIGTGGVRGPVVADREIVRSLPDRVGRIVKRGRLASRVRGPAGPRGRAAVNVHVVVHVRLLVPEIYGERWAT